MDRFKMDFRNTRNQPPMIVDKQMSQKVAPMSTHLNAPMISRIHRAKQGCSACGKKVA